MVGKFNSKVSKFYAHYQMLVGQAATHGATSEEIKALTDAYAVLQNYDPAFDDLDEEDEDDA